MRPISRSIGAAALLYLAITAAADAQTSELNPNKWGVVLDSPATKNVSVTKDVTYLKDSRSTLGIDIYKPADAKSSDKRPAVIFLNGIGDRPNDKLKNWGIYSSWPRLIAAHGMIGISMEADADRVQDSLAALFTFLEKEGLNHGIDASRLGVYSASANTSQSLVYLMSDKASPGIRAAALYYGATPAAQPPIRKDLPVLYILAEGDLDVGLGRQSLNLWQRVTEAKAPWTLMFASRMVHAFDAFQDDDDSRRIVMQTIAFWKTHLEPVPQSSWERSPAREIVASTYGNDWQKTLDLVTKYLADHPRDAQGWVYRGRALNSLGRSEEAVTAFERAVEFDPENVFGINGLGQSRLRQGRYAEAEKLLSKAIAGGFRNAMVYSNLAQSQIALNKNEEAVANYQAAFQMVIPAGASTRGIAYFNLARAHARLRNADKVFEMLNKAVDEGYVVRDSFEKDDDFAPFRSDVRFTAVLDRLQKAAPDK